MTATTQTLLLLSAVLVVVAIVARRLNTAPSILLVIAGIGLALAPGLPRIELAPELVLLTQPSLSSLTRERRTLVWLRPTAALCCLQPTVSVVF